MYDRYRDFTPLALCLVLGLIVSDQATGADEAPARDEALGNVAEPLEFWSEEPVAKEFSLRNVARYLDQAALHWQKKRKCGTCHTNFAYLVARPALASVLPPARQVREFIEDMVTVRWKEEGPRWDAEVVVAASTLAINDGATTGTLQPVTRTALERMYQLQRPDGGWNWLKCGWPPMESDDHYGVTFAALGIGKAPGNYAKTPEAEECLEGVRKYLRAHPAPSLHHRLMVLWASCCVDGLMTKAEREQGLEATFALQLSDGGWAVAALLDDWKEHKRKDDEPQSLEVSDGYGTGFVVYVAREAGVPADDPRLQRGIQWLKEHQRTSGRWFTPSPTKDSKHFISNAGTAFAAMALAACGEIERREPRGAKTR